MITVKLNKNDTCLSYALKRIGLISIVNDVTFENIHEYFESLLYTEKKKIESGDLLLWKMGKLFGIG